MDDKEFQATPNTRNEMMMIEAQEFAGHLRRCEKDIRKMQGATEGAAWTMLADESRSGLSSAGPQPCSASWISHFSVVTACWARSL